MQQNKATADVYLTKNISGEQKIGTIKFTDTVKGLLVEGNLHDLPQGEHGFHIHENPNCNAAVDANGEIQPALAAGGHFDPQKTGKHLGPNGNGHKGDLPVLNVASDGTVKINFYVPKLTVNEIKQRSIVIHAGGDNYHDEPLALGGGGVRIACGIIK